MTGKVKTITGKGFGFITSEENSGDDIFFHSSALVGVTMDELREGDEVTFETEQSDKGPRAINVSRA